MKKRIIAVILSVSVLCFSLFGGARRRAYADPATVIVVGSALILACEIMMTASNPSTAEFLDDFFDVVDEELEYYIIGSDITDMQGNVIGHVPGMWETGFDLICQSVQDLIDSGDISRVEGEALVMGKSSFHHLYNQAIYSLSRFSVDFTCGFDYMLYSFDSSLPISAVSLPHIDSFLTSSSGESYSLVYYNDSQVIFSDFTFRVSFLNTNALVSLSRVYDNYVTDIAFDITSSCLDIAGKYTSLDFSQLMSDLNCSIFMPNLSVFILQYLSSSPRCNSTDCFVYENGSLSRVPVSSVNTSEMSYAILTTTGDYGSFLKSISDFSASVSVPDTVDPSLPDALPDDAILSFPLNPDASVPIPDQIGVEVEGVPDASLSEYTQSANLDIDIPSIIVDKFPFCIPFDFVRFLSLLCADPVAPVFRIPISTSSENLDFWKGNETVGEYIDGSPPLFEIDEEIVLDLSCIPLVQPICYTCFIVGFLFLLIHITPKMIQH